MQKVTKLLTIVILILGNISFVTSCTKPPDQKAYEEIVATMSMEKAKRFFDAYPESYYRDKLADEIIGWCKYDETEECYKMILDAIPKNYPQYEEVAAYHKKHFGNRK